jgi:hypothetical protein
MKWLSNEKLDIQMINFNHIHGKLTSGTTFIRKAMNCLIQVHLMFMTIFFHDAMDIFPTNLAFRILFLRIVRHYWQYDPVILQCNVFRYHITI